MNIFKLFLLLVLVSVAQTTPSSTRSTLFNTHSSNVETDPRMVETDPKMVETDPRTVETDLKMVETDPRMMETDPRKMVEHCTRSCKHEHLRTSRNLEDYNDCLNDCIMLNVGYENLQEWLLSFEKP